MTKTIRVIAGRKRWYVFAIIVAATFAASDGILAEEGLQTTQKANPTSTVVAPPDSSIHDAEIVDACKVANELLSTSTGLKDGLTAALHAVAGNATARPTHKGTDTVKMSCAFKNGRLVNVVCADVDGQGFELDLPDGVVNCVTTLKNGKPDGFFIDISPSGRVVRYCQLHDGRILGRYIVWNGGGEVVEERTVDQPEDLQSLIRF